MQELPLDFQNYFPEKRTGANVTYSYWYESRDVSESEKGGIGLFVSLSGPGDFAGERASKFMWDSFREEYLFEFSNVTDSLRRAVKAARDRLIDLMKNEESVSDQGVDVHMIAFAIKDGKFFASLAGEPDFMLIKGNQIIDLKDMLPTYDGRGYRNQISVGSFELAKSDVLLFSTPQLLNSLFKVWEQMDEREEYSWRFITNEIDKFAEDMSGNQYIWLMGYDIDEEDKNGDEDESIEVAAEVETDRQDESNEESVKKQDMSGKDFPRDKNKKEAAAKEASDKETADGRKPQKKKAAGADKGDSKSPNGDLEARKGSSAIKSAKKKGFPELSGVKTFADKAGGKIKKFFNELSSSKIWTKINPVSRIQDFISNKPSLKSFQRNIKSKLSKIKIGGNKKKKIFVSKSGVSGVGGKASKIMIAILVVAVVGLVGLLVYRSYQRRVYRAAIEAEVTETEDILKSAQKAWNVEKNEAEAEKLIAEFRSNITQLRSKEITEEQVAVLDNYEDQILALSDDINKITPLKESSGNIEIVMDAYLEIGEEAEVADIEKRGEYIYLTDKTSSTLYRYKIDGSVAEPVANSEDIFENPVHVAIDDNNIFVYDAVKGVLSIDLAGEWEFKSMPELSTRSIGGEISEIETFGGNLYMFDSANGRVLRSMPAGAGFTYPTEYFGEGYLKGAVDLLIDGNIYIVSNSAEKLYKFYLGNKDNFQISGLDKPLGQLVAGYTNHYGDKPLWVFDQTNKRIVTIEKGTENRHPGSGVMIDQMVYRGERDDIFNDVKELVADTDGRNLYVLDGSRVLRVSLDHVQ
jgi:protein-tyrosine-phosphatase